MGCANSKDVKVVANPSPVVGTMVPGTKEENKSSLK
jgi:hypothetical protein